MSKFVCFTQAEIAFLKVKTDDTNCKSFCTTKDHKNQGVNKMYLQVNGSYLHHHHHLQYNIGVWNLNCPYQFLGLCRFLIAIE